MHILTNNFTQVSEDSGFRLHVYRKFIFTWSKGVFCKSHTAVFCWGGDFPVLLKFWLVDLVSVEHSMIYLYFDLDSVSLRWSGHTITTPLMLAWCLFTTLDWQTPYMISPHVVHQWLAADLSYPGLQQHTAESQTWPEVNDITVIAETRFEGKPWFC